MLEIENTLLWSEENLGELPQINCLEGWGDSNSEALQIAQTNLRRWMRVFTTMSLTHSDGYVTVYIPGIRGPNHRHNWGTIEPTAIEKFITVAECITMVMSTFGIPFWDTDLGRPIGRESPTVWGR